MLRAAIQGRVVSTAFIQKTCLIPFFAMLSVLALGLPARAQPALKDTRKPVPLDAAAAAAEAKVMAVFGSEIAAAKRPTESRTVSRKMLALAKESTSNDDGQYALLRLTRQTAINGNDALTAAEATDLLVAAYAVDAVDLRMKMFTSIIESPLASPLNMADVVTAAAKAADETADNDNYQQALVYARVAYDAAQKSKDQKLIATALESGKALRAMQTEFTALAEAQRKLTTTPQDAAANMVVGRWRWFRKGDADAGIRHMAFTADAEMKLAAITDLSNPREPAAQAELGDRWWDRAMALPDDVAKPHLMARAAFWYRKSVNDLKGLEKAKVEKRLEEAQLETADGKARAAAKGVSLTVRDKTLWRKQLEFALAKDVTNLDQMLVDHRGRQALFGDNSYWEVFDLTNGTSVMRLPTDNIKSGVFTKNDGSLLTFDGQTLSAYDLRTKRELSMVKLDKSYPSEFAWSADSVNFATVDSVVGLTELEKKNGKKRPDEIKVRYMINVFETKTGRLLREYQTVSDHNRQLTWSNDSIWLAAGSPESMSIYDARNGARICTLDAFKENGLDVFFAEDRRYVFAVSSSSRSGGYYHGPTTIRVYEMPKGKKVNEFVVKEGVPRVQDTADHRVLMVPLTKGVLEFRDLLTGAVINKLDLGKDELIDAKIIADDRVMVVSQRRENDGRHTYVSIYSPAE